MILKYLLATVYSFMIALTIMVWIYLSKDMNSYAFWFNLALFLASETVLAAWFFVKFKDIKKLYSYHPLYRVLDTKCTPIFALCVIIWVAVFFLFATDRGRIILIEYIPAFSYLRDTPAITANGYIFITLPMFLIWFLIASIVANKKIE